MVARHGKGLPHSVENRRTSWRLLRWARRFSTRTLDPELNGGKLMGDTSRILMRQ
jgi:hypothetical protein